MNGIQKTLLILGLVGVAATMIVAPFKYRGYSEVRAFLGQGAAVSGVLYAPVWAAPSADDAGAASSTLSSREVQSVELDAGRLGLTWAAIAIATIAGMALSSGKKAFADTTNGQVNLGYPDIPKQT